MKFGDNTAYSDAKAPSEMLVLSLVAVCVALAAGLRLPGLFTDLWLDEVWSITDVQALQGWSDIFLRLKIDNNHHLNSLFIWWLGPQTNLPWYRALSFVSGIATVLLAFIIGRRDSDLAGIVAALVFGTSVLMTFYSSEARGYAPVVCFTLASWYFVSRYVESLNWRYILGFTICSALGVMAHQTFLLFFGGALLWCDLHVERSRSSVRQATRQTLALFGPAAVFIAMFYLVALRGQAYGGGPSYRALNVVGRLLSTMSGGPLAGQRMWVVAACVAVVILCSIAQAYRRGDDRWLLYSLSGIVLPYLILAVRYPPTLAPRYLIVPATVLLLASSDWIARLIARGGFVRLGGSALLIGHILGGVLFACDRNAGSRGNYREALMTMASSANHVATVASDDAYSGHDFRVGLLVDFYVRQLGLERRVRYVDAARLRNSDAEWIIVERSQAEPRPVITGSAGAKFTYVGEYRSGPLSGSIWRLYHRMVGQE